MLILNFFLLRLLEKQVSLLQMCLSSSYKIYLPIESNYKPQKRFKKAITRGTYMCAQACLQTPWTVACQAPLSMGFPRHEYWSGFPFPPLGIYPIQGSNPNLTSTSLAGKFFTVVPPRKPQSSKVQFSSVQLLCRV